MSSIDERVVEMKFDNGQFQRGVSTTINALDALKKGLNLDASRKGLEELDAAGKRFSLAGMTSGIEAVSGKFMALATVGITALANITTAAMAAGAQIVKSLTLDPVMAGFAEYELKMGSIQTIMAGSGADLATVNQKLQELNEYSDRTIYSFADMTSNIGKFTNAGVGLDQAVAAIQGVANVAALSGANANEASRSMYNFAQSLSQGSVKLMDWKSIELANMATVEFKNELIASALAAGTLTQSADGLYKTLDGSVLSATQGFNESLADGWLTSEALVTTLGRYADTTTDIGARATAAAQDVKTFSQMMDTLKESAGSGWAATSELIFGNFDEAKTLWTNVNNVIGGAINASADARNQILSDWKELGGRTVLIEALSNAFNALKAIIDPIKNAFREIFPPATGEQLFTITSALRDFTAALKIGESTASAIGRTFKGFFALIDIGRQIIFGIIGVLGSLFGEVTSGAGGILNFTANIGDFIVGLNEAIKQGQGLTNFFAGVSNVLKKVVDGFKAVGHWLGLMFSGFDEGAAESVSSAMESVQERLSPFARMGDVIANTWGKLIGILKNVWSFMAPFASRVAEMFGGLGERIGEAMKTMDYSSVLDTINTGFLGAIALAITRFFRNGININPSGGIIDSIKDALGGLTGTLEAMQTQLRADALFKIAAAIGLLALSVMALSLIDSAGLTRALTAMTVMFTQLYGSMAIFEKIAGSSGFAKMPVIAASMILLSVAILLLTASVRALSSLSWEELAKGLTGVGVLLGMIVVVSNQMPTSNAKMISTGVGFIALGIAIKVLASAVKDFADMNWEELGRGFAALGTALTSLTIFTRLANLSKMGASTGAGLLLLAISLKVIASAVQSFANMSWEELGRGFASMAVALLLIAGAMHLMPSNMLLTAVALGIVAGSLLLLGQVIKNMAGMSWEEIARGLVTLAGGLLIIAGAMYLMSGALAGAAALAVVAASMALLGPVLLAFGNMSWEEIGKGLAMLAGVFIVLGLAALVLEPVIPAMLLLGIAVALLGVGMMAAGVGMLAFSAGLMMLSVAGAAGTAALVAIVAGLIGLIPMAFEAVAQGIVAFAEVIGGAGPVFVEALVTVLMSLITAINTVAPAIIDTLMALILKMVDALATNVPKFVDAGLRMITGILQGIANNIGRIVTAATSIITNFIDGIAKNLPRVVQSGINLIITFVESLADGIRSNTTRMNAAGRDLASAIIQGMTSGLSAGINAVVNAARNVASNALSAAKRLLGINSPSKEFQKLGEYSGDGFIEGMDGSARGVSRAAQAMGDTALTTVSKTLAEVARAISTDMDASPTIRPVLDLSNVEKDARLVSGMFGTPTIRTDVGYNRAATIAEGYRQLETQRIELEAVIADNQQPSVTYIQNNTSPKALSTAEIYRQTRNQLSVVKGALPK